jgi:hypothetical protein
MMTIVWVAFPSADPVRCEVAVKKWRSRGYLTAVYSDLGREGFHFADLDMHGVYRGYWASCNALARECVSVGADIVVYAADDIDPEAKRDAGELGDDFERHFSGWFGVMQPCGDLQGIDSSGLPAAARICGSPWLGKEWIRRAYGGKWPTNEQYFHFYGDEELKSVAEMSKCLWMRPDVTQLHHHWSWGHRPKAAYQIKNEPYWDLDAKLFKERKASGFPGWEPSSER